MREIGYFLVQNKYFLTKLHPISGINKWVKVIVLDLKKILNIKILIRD